MRMVLYTMCDLCSSYAGVNYAPTPSDFKSYGQGGAALLQSLVLWRQRFPCLSQCRRLWPCYDIALPETVKIRMLVAGKLP